ncbi:hypothetical protein IDM40_04570 [Nocardiopsis sp. HNM0947]|uniref:Uncharacterized protein n=1 Tax=Nocardiopsis coralli TaxID=2772213 RepID=A0ABR9P2C3_9ACTN|nr:hypothetical protein [Nocardiopsis coralli]MBE2997984.1 hypothetical protein [Nocardiopsis coralli]
MEEPQVSEDAGDTGEPEGPETTGEPEAPEAPESSEATGETEDDGHPGGEGGGEGGGEHHVENGSERWSRIRNEAKQIRRASRKRFLKGIGSGAKQVGREVGGAASRVVRAVRNPD